ncbi:MAG: hypothetical protein JNM89_06220 [Hyphomicrobiaceae bacterium]|nr:hypothetical protein [Hyphomicrobiaceae bacterium]
MTNVDVASTMGQNDVTVPSEGYDTSRLNAVRHGILSRFTVLPWEDAAEYEALLDALTEEHTPAGPTETHLVVELAGVLWRKRRLRLAEIATYQRGLQVASDSSRTAQSALVASSAPKPSKIDVAAAIKASAVNTQRELADIDDDRQMTLTAIEILGSERNRAYEDALEALEGGTRDAWAEQLTWKPEDYDTHVKPYTADAASLQRYLESEILPWYDKQRAQIIAQPLVRAQALGESLDPDKLERLGRYEVHLDRKLERTLSTLIRLQELRRTKPPAAVQA